MAKKKLLITGNEAIAEAAIQAGCRFYAGYPITPQNEIPAYMAGRMPQVNGVFIQAESELAAINMVFGASLTGARAITTSSSPGISLKQEGISYLAGAELPAVIVNIMRGGPGLGNIAPAQSDYFQATKGGGHGDYHCIVLAPSTVQEAFDLTKLSFDLADKYRMPVIILGDGMLGQMMEPIVANGKWQMANRNDKRLALPAGRQAISHKPKSWALTGAKNRKPCIIRSLYLAEGKLEEINEGLQRKYKRITEEEQRCESRYLDDSQIVLVAYGTMSRIAKAAVIELRKEGKKIGFIQPITLWPFPARIFQQWTKDPIALKLHRAGDGGRKILVVEMSCGQMVEDVKLAVNGKLPVEFLGRAGGGVPTQEEIINKIRSL